MMNKLLKILLLSLVCTGALAQSSKTLYENNFDKATLDQVPDEFLILDGNFAVKEDAGNKFLELPGAPLDTYGVLFGPSEKENLSVTARVFGTHKGRRFPTFAVSLNGAGGYRLQVSPAKKMVELYKGDSLKTSVDYDWASGKWTYLQLQIRKVNDTEWAIEGKAWSEGAAAPAPWTISYTDKDAPIAGKAGVWGSPYATTPIRYDDLAVKSLP